MPIEPQTQHSAPAVQQGSHHFVITLQTATRNGWATGTWSHTWTPTPGLTREDVYRKILADLVEINPEYARANVLFFSLEPNQL
ncbi:hypothetical protein M1P56_24640 [Streptomyces sp. HU2014]|uniref:hypothetical protein n=1 Tax=Streptomyces sp. HU2014 TaxID=2939414 RepID=UPI00201078F0|nr:hypothetical protein [Streptomyces sp. HU2014]UQI47307.1 hypothetical protein M1P56_24640 [Streptomyces sp. HU2014]